MKKNSKAGSKLGTELIKKGLHQQAKICEWLTMPGIKTKRENFVFFPFPSGKWSFGTWWLERLARLSTSQARQRKREMEVQENVEGGYDLLTEKRKTNRGNHRSIHLYLRLQTAFMHKCKFTQP